MVKRFAGKLVDAGGWLGYNQFRSRSAARLNVKAHGDILALLLSQCNAH